MTLSHMMKIFYDTPSDFPPRDKTNDEFYPDSDQVHRRKQSVSDKTRESDKESFSATTTKRELLSSNGRRRKKR